MTEPITPTLDMLLDEDDLAGVVAFARTMHPAELAEALSGPDERLRDIVVPNLTPDELAPALAGRIIGGSWGTLLEAAREAGGAKDSAANSATAIVAPRAIRAGKMPIPRASQSGRPSPVRSSERCMPVCKPANRLVVSGQHGNIPDRGGVSLPACCG